MRCKYCKEKFEPLRFNQKFCLKTDCIQKAKDDHWKRVAKPKMKKELLTIQDHIKIAQQVFNKWIRLRDKGQPCISCGKDIKGVKHASHYKSAGGHYNVRFNEDNVWVSCYRCNVMLSGNESEYRQRLVKKIGVKKVEQIEELATKTRHFTIDQLKQITEEYKKKIKNFE